MVGYAVSSDYCGKYLYWYYPGGTLQKVLDKLSILNAPHAVVIRDGKRQEIPADQLVLDDIVEFSAGSQIPADAKVVSGELQVNESLITGESDEIEKREDSLLSGSFVVSGKACARLEKVGKDSYISKLTLQATKSKREAVRNDPLPELSDHGDGNYYHPDRDCPVRAVVYLQ